MQCGVVPSCVVQQSPPRQQLLDPSLPRKRPFHTDNFNHTPRKTSSVSPSPSLTPCRRIYLAGSSCSSLRPCAPQTHGHSSTTPVRCLSPLPPAPASLTACSRIFLFFTLSMWSGEPGPEGARDRRRGVLLAGAASTSISTLPVELRDLVGERKRMGRGGR